MRKSFCSLARIGMGLAWVASCTGTVGAGDVGGDPGTAGDDTGTTNHPPVTGTGGNKVGTGGTGGAGPVIPVGIAACPATTPARLRRLTTWEYDNTVRDLLGDTTRPGEDFPADDVKGFDNDIDLLSVDRVLAGNFGDAAERLATNMVKDLPGALKCDTAAQGEDVCAQSFFASFGARAWRHPLDAGETSYLQTAYGGFKTKYDFADAIRMTVQFMLQSPNFLYRPELGVAGKAGDTTVRLSQWEVASRLSFLLWGSMPDAVLFQAVRDGKLGTKDQVADQARRMLKDARAHAVMAHFNEQWLHLGLLDTLDRDAATYPTFTAAIPVLLRGEMDAFLEDVIWQGKANLATLMTAPYSFANTALAKYYGVSGSFTGDMKKVDVDPQRRSGLLTRGALMAELAHGKSTSPVQRGVFVLSEIMCAPPPPPPADVNTTLMDADQTATARTQMIQHERDPFCAGCHKVIDSVGLAFENYDGVGLWRNTDKGQAIDASGEFLGTDVAGKFTGAVELGKTIAGSAQANDCLMDHWFRYAYGRLEADGDQCTLAALKKSFGASGNNIIELVVALTQADDFMSRAADPSAGGAR